MMKKLAAIVFLFFLITYFGYCQNQSGVKAGANVSAIAADNSSYAKNTGKRIGYYLGFWAAYALSQKLFYGPNYFIR